jgi:hypothetical protein
MIFGAIKYFASQSILTLILRNSISAYKLVSETSKTRGLPTPPPPGRSPFQPHPSILCIHIQPHILLPPQIPTNDGGNEIVNPPQFQF